MKVVLGGSLNLFISIYIRFGDTKNEKNIYNYVYITTLLSGCKENDNIKNIYTDEINETIYELEYLNSDESPIKLNKSKMPDFGTYSIKCLTQETYSPPVPELEFHEQTTGNIQCYTIYNNTFYFAVSFDDYHEFSHIIKLFSYDLQKETLTNIYTFENIQESVLLKTSYEKSIP